MAVWGSLVGQVAAMPLTWRGTQLKRLGPFVVGGLLGVPLGIFLLGILDPTGFKLGLGLFLLIYCPAMFFAPSPRRPGRCAGAGPGRMARRAG